MLNIAGIIDLITQRQEGSNTDDVIDQLNYGITVYILGFFALLTGSKQHFGNPIQCIAPAESSDSWVNYYHDYCFIQEKIVLKNWNFYNSRFERKINPNENLRVAYYQWVPYVLFLQALCFLAPSVIGKCIGNYLSKGCDIGHVLAEVSRLRENLGKERKNSLTILSSFISRTLKWNKSKAVFGEYSFCLNYSFCKFLILLNSGGQWYLLSQFVGGGDYYWGFEVLAHVIGSSRIAPSEGAFPRIVQCVVDQAQVGAVHPVNMQCVLMLNYINEKIYVFLYFWLLLITSANILSLLRYLIFLCFRSYRIRSINYLVPLRFIVPAWSTDRFAKQAHNYLGADGILLLQFIEKQAGGLMTYEIAKLILNSMTTSNRNLSSDKIEDAGCSIKKCSSIIDENDDDHWDNLYPTWGSRIPRSSSRGPSCGPHASAPELSHENSKDSTLQMNSALCSPDARNHVVMVHNKLKN